MLPSFEFYSYEKHPKKISLYRDCAPKIVKSLSATKNLFIVPLKKRSLLDSVHVCIYPPIHPPIESKAIVSQFLLH